MARWRMLASGSLRVYGNTSCRTPIQPSSFSEDAVEELGKGAPEQVRPRIGVQACDKVLRCLAAPSAGCPACNAASTRCTQRQQIELPGSSG